MRQHLERTIVMVGMMGAGKTAVGQALARRLQVPFFDSDHEIERAADRSIAEIFTRDGEAFFRDREAQVIARLLQGQRGVLSIGGGAFLSARTRAAIGADGVSVWLRASIEVLWPRVRRKTTRPLLRTADPRGTLARLIDERAEVYALADITVDASPKLSAADMAALVHAAVAARDDVLA